MNTMNGKIPKDPAETTVVVGMSGGVDSSVAALLLKQQGYRVVGLFMKNWEETTENGQCSAAADYEDVAWTCSKLDIPFYAVNFAKEYREQVFQDFLQNYSEGLTPNPDILCNREIKFKVFFDKAMSMGADFLATGHYCLTQNGKLLKSPNREKDQSYFLSGINGQVLPRVLFPIGHLDKTEVRKIADEHNLPAKSKKDSTGICFIGERKFRPFLQEYIKAKPGLFCKLDGTPVGEHHGAVYYTLGQRKQLGLGGSGERWYVVKKDHSKNVVYVERGDHPQLYCQRLTLTRPTWIESRPTQNPVQCMAKIRYRQSDQACTLTLTSEGKLEAHFETPQRAAAPGQTVAFYQGETCLGGAVIESLGASSWESAQISHKEATQRVSISF